MKAFNSVAVERLAKKSLDELTFERFVTALNALGNAKKERLLEAIRTGRVQLIGRRVLDAVKAGMKNDAQGSLDSMLTDNKLSKSELEDIFGG